MRVGHGYDVHRMKTGRKCILCGVEIPYEYGPDGHSDADVPVHALMDAMLGAAALGDIGRHFPDSDNTYAGANSLELLRHVCRLITDAGYALSNADITIIAQRPKLAGYIPEMRERLATVIGVDTDRMNIKATTEEGLGFTGSCAAISAHAVVLLE
jgi:2-C-methyl-D-erythritol 2,4-cyclodiphosphate synthase